tara:strand:- start:272 stop:925 length:654 start_codon:yes stop_codon:yes gene_type:complete
MIAAFTADAWSTAEITLDDGGGAQVFTVPAGVANAYNAAEEFRDWVDGTFGDTAAWTWARDTTTGAAVITFSLPLGYTMSTNAAAQSILGADAAGGPGMTSTDWTAPAGTIAPMTVGAGAIVDQRVRVFASRGRAAAVGVARHGVGALAAYRTRVRWPVAAVDMERARAVQAGMSSPRKAHIYGGAAYGWLFDLSVGTVTLAKSGIGLWRAVAEVRG